MSDVVSNSDLKKLIENVLEEQKQIKTDMQKQFYDVQKQFCDQQKHLDEQLNKKFAAHDKKMINLFDTYGIHMTSLIQSIRAHTTTLSDRIDCLAKLLDGSFTHLSYLMTKNAKTTNVLVGRTSDVQEMQGYIFEHIVREILVRSGNKGFPHQSIVSNLLGLCSLLSSLLNRAQDETKDPKSKSENDPCQLEAERLAKDIVENNLDFNLLEVMNELITLFASASTSTLTPPSPYPSISTSTSTSTDLSAWRKRRQELSEHRQKIWNRLPNNPQTAEEQSIKQLLVELGKTLTSMKALTDSDSSSSDEEVSNVYIKFLSNNSFGLYCILAHTIKEKKKIFSSFKNALEFDWCGHISQASVYNPVLEIGEIKSTSNNKTSKKASTQLLIRAAPLAYAFKKLYNPSTKIHFDLRFLYFKAQNCQFNFESHVQKTLTDEIQNLMTLTWSPNRVMSPHS